MLLFYDSDWGNVLFHHETSTDFGEDLEFFTGNQLLHYS